MKKKFTILPLLIAIFFIVISRFNDPSSFTVTNRPYDATTEYTFRNEEALESHYEKHGIEMGFSSSEEYEARASEVIVDPEVLHKIEQEDGDDVYYLEKTNEFVIVSTDGYIRTYFYPDDGIDYYNRQ